MARRRGRRRRRRSTRSRLDYASPVDPAAQRDALDLERRASGARIRRGWNAAVVMGRTGQGLRVAATRARHLRRRRRCGLAGRRRRKGRADSQVHERRTIPSADRAPGERPRQQRRRESWRPGADDRRCRSARTVRGRRLREPPRHRLRLAFRRVQAALGRLRQAAGRRVLSSG